MGRLAFAILGSLGCHGIPDRCFRIRGKPFPLCARCVGVLIGEIASVAFLFLAGFPAHIATLSMCLPAVIDWSLQQFFGLMSSNRRRVVTGLLAGFGYGSLLIRLFLWVGKMILRFLP